MIRVVFIDVDNTLLSFSGYVRESMKNGFALFGLPPYEESMFDVFNRVNGGLWKQLEQGTLTFEELIRIRWNKVFEALNIVCDGVAFEDYFRKQLFTSAVPEPGAMEMLEYLRGKYTLCVASNGPYEQQVNRLRVGGMKDYFSHFFVSEKIGASKPSKAFFEACFKELHESGMPDLTPQETIIIGDSLSSDIAGGKAYGMHTCLYHPKGAADGADHVITSLTDITGIL